MQIKNYTAQACRDLQQLIESMRGRDPHHPDLVTLQWLVNALQEAVHFALPDFGRIFDDAFKGLYDAELRLPFPLISIEYTVPTDKGVNTKYTIHAPKRVILAVEVSSAPGGLEHLPEHLQPMLQRSLETSSLHRNGRGILVWGASSVPAGPDGAYIFSPELCMWVLPDHYPAEDEIQYDRVKHLGQEGVNSHNLNRQSGTLLGYEIIPLVATLEIAKQSGYRTHEEIDMYVERISMDIAQEAVVVLELIEAMSCSNVTHEIAQPAAKPSVAAKRARAGKLPIFETRVLTIRVPGRAAAKTAVSTMNGGSRASPRQHLRRGHIRRLDSGKRVWVQSTVVGGNTSGMIAKSYRVSTR